MSNLPPNQDPDTLSESPCEPMDTPSLPGPRSCQPPADPVDPSAVFGDQPFLSPLVPPAPRRAVPWSLRWLAVLIPYALVVTAGFIYLLQRQLTRGNGPHILESIPDQGLYEDYLEARRKEAMPPIGQAGEKPAASKTISPSEPLPDYVQPLRLGQTGRIGDLGITPLEVSRQALHFDFKNSDRHVAGDEALVLKLQVENEGRLIFRPDDETFNRAYLDDNRIPVYTYLEIAGKRFYGAVADPSLERLNLPRCPPLLPGESSFIYVNAARGSDGKTLAVAALASADGPLLWRVHIRRGKETVNMTSGKQRQVWVTAVIPVQFTSAQIKP